MDATERLCECHAEPMIWKKDRRKPHGGVWRCAVKIRAHDESPERARSKRDWLRREYDRDPVRRHRRLLGNARWKREKRIEERRGEITPSPALADFLRNVRGGGSYGPLQK